VKLTSGSSASFTVSTSQSWILISPQSGAASSSGAPVAVTVDPGAFNTAGAYRGDVVVTPAGGSAVSFSVTIQVDITAPQVSIAFTPDPVYEQAPDSDGYTFFYKVQLNHVSGPAAKITRMAIGGKDYSTSIQAWFGALQIPAGGKVSTSLRSRQPKLPTDLLFEFAGTSATGSLNWSASQKLSFLPKLTKALVKLTINPNPVAADPAAPSSCRWKHVLQLDEQAGIAVTLKRFVAYGFDLSSDIATWFGAAVLPANGELATTVCWSNINVPATVEFEIGGDDAAGNKGLDWKTTAQFTGPPR